MKHFRIFIAAVFLFLFVAGSATAGVYMDVVGQTFSDRPDTINTKIYIESDRLRADSKGSGQDLIFIYRADKDLVWVINNNDRTYMELTRADMEKFGDKMKQARKQFEDQMANMPPEQRAMMEKMMKDKMPQMSEQKKSEVVYNKTGSGIAVNKWVCDKYDGTEGGKRIEEVWTTDLKSIGLNTGDFKVFDSFVEFFKALPKGNFGFEKYGSAQGNKGKSFSGIPIKTVEYEANGRKARMTEVKDISNKKNDASLFNLPAGLMKQQKN
ncbi:MAG: DUF4412 domain-containing protein [Chloroflexi bacterium]|nr:DUF4412 domain-containing protein [Chloroflexota bacterium]